MRLFIGLRVEGEAQAALAKASECLQRMTEGNFVSPALYHLTVAYLGERDATAIPALNMLLADAAARTHTFTLICDSFDSFTMHDRFLLYASFQPCEALLQLNRQVRERLTLAGEPFDPKPLVPHVTLARKATDRPDAAKIPWIPQPLSVMALTLFHSVRIDGCLRYIPIADHPLGSSLGACDAPQTTEG